MITAMVKIKTMGIHFTIFPLVRLMTALAMPKTRRVKPTRYVPKQLAINSCKGSKINDYYKLIIIEFTYLSKCTKGEGQFKTIVD